MTPPKEEAMYRGKKLKDMTREEIVDALIVMGNLYSRSLEQMRKDLHLLKEEALEAFDPFLNHNR